MLARLTRFGYVLVAISAVISTVAMPAAAHPIRPSDTYYSFYYRAIDKHAEGASSGDWTHCFYVSKAKYRQTATCSKGKTVAETVSGGAGYSRDEISESVGFSVTYSSTVSSSVSVSVNPGGSGWFDVGFRFERYRAVMQTKECRNPGDVCTPWESNTSVQVQKHLGDTYHYFGSGAS